MVQTPHGCPQLRFGTRYANATAFCAGCGQSIDCDQHYLELQLENCDGTVQPTDDAFTYFHSEHCIAHLVTRGHARPYCGMLPRVYARDRIQREAQSHLDTFYYA